MTLFTFFLFNLYSSKKKGPIESKISFARVTWPRGVFLPMSAFPPIFQRFKYRSAVEQTSSAQYRLSVRSQTAGQLDAHQPARLTRERKAASQVNFTYYSLKRKKKVCLPQSRPLIFFLNDILFSVDQKAKITNAHIQHLSRSNVNLIWLHLRTVVWNKAWKKWRKEEANWNKSNVVVDWTMIEENKPQIGLFSLLICEM